MNEISFALQKMRNELLSNPEKLKSIQAQHERANSKIEKSHEELAKERLLSTRLSLNLNRTRIAESTLKNAGRGLFATQDIANGTLITCYPGDALVCEYVEPDGEKEYAETNELEDDTLSSDEELEVILWGDHIDTNDRIEDDEVFDGEEDGMPPLISYAASVDDIYSVIGIPNLDHDPAYFGHFANDGGGCIALRQDHDSMGVEEMLSLYVEKSVQMANARHVPLGDGMHLGTVSIKDIKKDEEIMVSYGPEYWIGIDI